MLLDNSFNVGDTFNWIPDNGEIDQELHDVAEIIHVDYNDFKEEVSYTLNHTLCFTESELLEWYQPTTKTKLKYLLNGKQRIRINYIRHKMRYISLQL